MLTTFSQRNCPAATRSIYNEHDTCMAEPSLPLSRRRSPPLLAFKPSPASQLNGKLQQQNAVTLPPPRPRQKVDAENVFKEPGRRYRPDKICIILRGLPGSGKSHVARLLRDLENVGHTVSEVFYSIAHVFFLFRFVLFRFGVLYVQLHGVVCQDNDFL